MSLNDISESEYPIRSNPLLDADTLTPQELRCSGRGLQGASVAGRPGRLYGRLRPLLTAFRE